MGIMKRSRAGGSDEQGEPHPQKRRKGERVSTVSTRSMIRTSVSNAVFLTTELLENVLSFLPMKDLLLAQRVSYKWRAVITESKRLQQVLYLLPREPDAYWELILAPKPENKLIRITKEEYNRKLETSYVFKSGSMNPLLFKRTWKTCELDSEMSLLEKAEDGGSETFVFRSPPSTKHANASWRRMFLTQPPATGELFTHYAYERNPDLEVHSDHFPGNITIADAMARIETAEAEGDVVEWDSTFLGITDVLCPDDDEARMTCISRASDDEGSEDIEDSEDSEDD